jgi:hypothetical protein
MLPILLTVRPAVGRVGLKMRVGIPGNVRCMHGECVSDVGRWPRALPKLVSVHGRASRLRDPQRADHIPLRADHERCQGVAHLSLSPACATH